MKEDHQKALKKLTLFSDTRRSYKIGSVGLSARPSVWGLSWNYILSFSKFWHGARKPYEVVRDRAGFFGKNVLLPQELEKWSKNGSKKRLFEFVEKVCTCSMMKIYIICYAPAQILYLENFLFLTYGPKCSQTIRFQEFLMNRISIKDNCNCSGPPLFKIQRVGCQSNQKTITSLLALEKSAQFINYFLGCSRF